MFVSASVNNCFLTSISDLTELSAPPSSGSVWEMEHYHLLITVHIIWSSLSLYTGRADNGIHGWYEESMTKAVWTVPNLSWTGDAWWPKGCVASVFRAANVAFVFILLLLLLLLVSLAYLLLPPEDCDRSRLILEHLDWANIKYLQELRALCWMKRVSSWSRKSFLHSPQVKVSPPTTVGSEKKELDVVKNVICVWFQLSVEGASLPVYMRFWFSLGQMTLLQSQ